MPAVETENILKSFSAKIRQTDSSGEIIARVSTATVDREGDVLLPGGIDLNEFKGTMLLNHDSGMLPIGKWDRAEKKGSGIIMHGRLAQRPPEHPMMCEWVPDTIKSLIQQEVLTGVSVGFMIKSSRPANTKDAERYGPNVRRVINEWQLLEVSIVPVGCNPEAVVQAIGKSAFKSSALMSIWGLDMKIPLDIPAKPDLLLSRRARIA